MMKYIGNENTTEDLLLTNKKIPLSIDGERLAERISMDKEYTNIDAIYSSSYSRALATSKYFANHNNLKINVEEDLGERKQGVKSWDDLPADFEMKQFNDENYKINDGESKKQVKDRMLKVFNRIINENLGKRIIIVGHATAFSFLLSEWCNVNYNEAYTFNDKPFFSGNWKYCQAFKLELENDKLIDIKETY